MDMDLLAGETARKMEVSISKYFPANLQKLCSLQLMGKVLVFIKLHSRQILFSLYNEVS